MELEISQVNKLIRDRRSIFPRDFSGEPVDRKAIETMLENANWAPTHKFTEPWRFVVFHGNGIKKFAEFQADQYKIKSDAAGDFSEEKYNRLLQKPRRSSYIIAVYMRRDPEERVPEIEELIAVGCAIQNIYLTMSAYKLGGYLSTGNVNHNQATRGFLGMGDHDILIGYFHIGCFEGEWPRSIRKDVNEKITWRLE